MMMFSIVTVNAQIAYTDVNPDVVSSCNSSSVCSGNFSLDLNNDGITDFILESREKQFYCSSCWTPPSGGGHGGHGWPWGGNPVPPPATRNYRDSAVISSTSQSWIADQPGGYALNTLIDSSLNWTNALHILASDLPSCVTCTSPSSGSSVVRPPASGPWLNVSGKYLALKTQVGTDFYYGWIKLGVAIGGNTVSITIMEYAYNSIPNQPTLAGVTNTTGINENSFASSINLFPNPASNHLTIALGSNNKKAEVTITDITGKIVYTTTEDPDSPDSHRDRENKIEVNTSEFAAGIYIVQIQSAGFIATKKLVVKK